MATFGVAPSEYWKMTPNEVWLLIGAKTPKKMYGNLTEDQYDDLVEKYYEMGLDS